MKLVFFSRDGLEVERVVHELARAGIACETRHGLDAQHALPNVADTELWLLNDIDSSSAFLVCVQSGVGFGRPKTGTPEAHFWSEAA